MVRRSTKRPRRLTRKQLLARKKPRIVRTPRERFTTRSRSEAVARGRKVVVRNVDRIPKRKKPTAFSRRQPTKSLRTVKPTRSIIRTPRKVKTTTKPKIFRTPRASPGRGRVRKSQVTFTKQKVRKPRKTQPRIKRQVIKTKVSPVRKGIRRTISQTGAGRLQGQSAIVTIRGKSTRQLKPKPIKRRKITTVRRKAKPLSVTTTRRTRVGARGPNVKIKTTAQTVTPSAIITRTETRRGGRIQTQASSFRPKPKLVRKPRIIKAKKIERKQTITVSPPRPKPVERTVRVIQGSPAFISGSFSAKQTFDNIGESILGIPGAIEEFRQSNIRRKESKKEERRRKEEAQVQAREIDVRDITKGQFGVEFSTTPRIEKDKPTGFVVDVNPETNPEFFFGPTPKKLGTSRPSGQDFFGRGIGERRITKRGTILDRSGTFPVI